MEQFKVTEAHLKLARNMYVSWEDCEFGAPSIDCKRPYGNSAVVEDILKILGFPIPEDGEIPESLSDYVRKLHKEMKTALQIFLYTQKFETGVYENKSYGVEWKKIEKV